MKPTRLYRAQRKQIMINIQPIEKQVTLDNQMLDVHSMFYTIQGEGPFTGCPCVFVRLAGCNLQCPGCDTEYTQGRRELSPKDILNHINELWKQAGVDYHNKFVVITGGEPFRQRNIRYLLEELVKNDICVQIESNGTLAPVEFTDKLGNTGYRYNKIAMGIYAGAVHIVCSPKTGKVNPLMWEHCCCVKYVLKEGDIAEDGLPIHALDHRVAKTVARPPFAFSRPIYLQPMDEQNEERNALNVKAVLQSALKHGYILQLQIHKYLGVE